MKTFSKILVVALGLAFTLALAGPLPVSAATAPTLGSLSTFGVVSDIFTNSNTPPQTIINGNVCYTTGPASAPVTVTGTYGVGCPASSLADQNAALAIINGQACTPISGTLNAVTIGANPPGTFPAGCYSVTGAMDITAGTTVTLDATAPGGDGGNVWIFKSSGALTTGDNSKVVLANGANANNVFWAPGGGTTIGANAALSPTPTFVGNIFRGTAAGLSITLGHFAHLLGRTLAFGSTVTTDANTITVPTLATTLRVIKTVVNNSGGILVPSDFTMHIKLAGYDVIGSPSLGAVAPGTSYSLAAGTYVVSENPNAFYTQTFSGDCNSSGNIILAAGDNKTCTITNDDIGVVPSTLRVIKHVINDNGGTAVASNFTMHVKLLGADVLGSPEAGLESPGTTFPLAAGTYVVSENPNALYTQTFSGDCNSSGNVTLAAGNNKVCTITNDDIPPAPSTPTDNTITVIKHVINDNGRTATYTDFPLFINGNPVTSGHSTRFTPGTYTVTETGSTNYTTTFSGDCDAAGRIIHGGLNTHNDICIVTNDDIGTPVVVPPVPPLIDVVKVPSPLALPAGPGSVTYTYTLRNIGTVPVTNVTMIGDTCSPIVLISGDVNADAKLDVSETWVHTCTTTLSATHTNTVVATGRANGLSATDVASATVVVGEPIVPPLIHVTKVPSPLTLLAGGGWVTYTKKVTNPGTVALSNVSLTDDKCSPMNYISGDTNSDAKLDTTETWTYTCRTNLTRTTTNTAVVTGQANGLTARDFAIATVVVAAAVAPVPALPNTGFAPEGKNAPLDIIVLSSIFMLATISFAVVIRKSTI